MRADAAEGIRVEIDGVFPLRESSKGGIGTELMRLRGAHRKGHQRLPLCYTRKS